MVWRQIAAALLAMASGSASGVTVQPVPVDYMTAPFSMTRLLDWGTRPDWSADGRRIGFTQDDERDTHAYEIELASREVRCVTCHLGMAGLVTRIYYLPDGSYLFLAPRNLGAKNAGTGTSTVSNVLDQELYWLPKDGGGALQPLGAPAFGEIAISRRPASDGSVRLAWGELGRGTGKLHLATLSNDGRRAALTGRRTLYDSTKAHSPATVTMAETYGFAQDDKVVIFYTILKDGNDLNGEMMAVDVATGTLRPFYSDPHHNETHLLADERYGLEETNRASDPSGPWRGVSSHGGGIFASMKPWGDIRMPTQAELDAYPVAGRRVPLRRGRPFDLYVVRIDGAAPPRRLTGFSETGANTHQSVPAPDGRRIAFAIDLRGVEEMSAKGGLYVGEFGAAGASTTGR